MAIGSKLELDVEVKSSADKFWGGITNSADLFPKIFPDQYKSIEVVEGDGKSVGSIRLIKHGQAVPNITFVKEKLEAVDEENKLVISSVVDGELTNFFKIYKTTLHVVPKGDGGLVNWVIEYEKVNDEVPEPNQIMENATKTFQGLDEYLLKN